MNLTCKNLQEFQVKMFSYDIHLKMISTFDKCLTGAGNGIVFLHYSICLHLFNDNSKSALVKQLAETVSNPVASVLEWSSVITSMGAVSMAVTGAIRESSAPKVVHLSWHLPLHIELSAHKAVHLH